MAAPVKVTREDHTARELRQKAAELKDAGQARRLQAISFVLDKWSRGEAAVKDNGIPIECWFQMLWRRTRPS